MIATGTRVALTVVTIFAWFAAGQRITTIQLDGTQYYISRMNPYSAELNYFLAYEYCRSIGLQLASFETLEKTNSISDFLRNAGYNKFDYWTSGNRLGTDMLIWMSTGLPFNTTFSQMKRPSTDNNGLDNEENLKMNARPELPIARKKRGESGSRDGCVAIKAPNMDWVTADCTDLKDFICEQTRCYYYNYGSIPVSSSQGFAYKQYKPSAASIYSTASAITSEENTTTPAAPVITTTTFIASPTVITTTSSSTSITTLSTEGYEEPVIKDDTKPNGPVPETDKTAATTVDPNTAAEDLTTEQQNYQEESQTVDEQQPTNEPDVQYYTTELPTLIQMHNQQQQQEQQQHDRYRQREHHQQQPDANNQKREDRPQQEQQNDNNAFAFESLEKAFATAVPHKIRSTKDLEQPKGTVDGVEQLPWSWAKDIMLQKPVLKKSSQEVV